MQLDAIKKEYATLKKANQSNISLLTTLVSNMNYNVSALKALKAIEQKELQTNTIIPMKDYSNSIKSMFVQSVERFIVGKNTKIKTSAKYIIPSETYEIGDKTIEGNGVIAICNKLNKDNENKYTKTIDLHTVKMFNEVGQLLFNDTDFKFDSKVTLFDNGVDIFCYAQNTKDTIVSFVSANNEIAQSYYLK